MVSKYKCNVLFWMNYIHPLMNCREPKLGLLGSPQLPEGQIRWDGTAASLGQTFIIERGWSFPLNLLVHGFIFWSGWACFFPALKICSMINTGGSAEEKKAPPTCERSGPQLIPDLWLHIKWLEIILHSIWNERRWYFHSLSTNVQFLTALFSVQLRKVHCPGLVFIASMMLLR